MRAPLLLVAGVLLALGAACKPPEVKSSDYTRFRAENPRSILIVPVVNRTVDVTAPDCFLSTVSRPVAERGYYVYPVYLVKRILEDDGLSDANLVHQADPRRLGALFGADTILYVTIDRWEAKYAVIAATVEVEFRYSLKSGKTGEEIWSSKEFFQYTPNTNSSGGNPLATLVAAAVSAAITKAAPNYIPLAQAANAAAVNRLHRGLPAGPYHAHYLKDQGDF